jgi:glutaredoxin 2
VLCAILRVAARRFLAESETMKLFVYDHCPFCVKARAAFGLKDVDFDLAILPNDDEATPTRMIGKKMAPILEHDGHFIAESMDIVAHVDALRGPKILAGPRNEAIMQWISDVSDPLFRLALPRWAAADLEEFATPAARAYFKRNKEAMIGDFGGHSVDSPHYIAALNRRLPSLGALILSPEAANGSISEDDIHLFAALRSMSIVRGIVYPTAVEAYRKRMAELTGVDLHDRIAT